ncbi:Fe(3+) ABC transporter substrate-binding protein [Benzoatithermus flavus]|uniref:Fe(3+) ABC transporter substrate-binding protein n=1 Tax=Benzoatithermus flavus TaxID=3108223 RepID=A0ABU8XVT9_9PROT
MFSSKLSRRAVLAASVVLTLVGPAAAEEVVNIYNSRHYGTDQQLWDGFTKATGIQVNVVEGTHEQLIQRMKSEGARSPADVFITVDAGRLAEASGLGLLQPVRSPVLEKAIPAHLRDPDGLWYGLAMRARILAYAKDRVKPEELSTYEALAEPRFKGKILVRSSTSVYNLSLVGSILAADGSAATEKWCEGLVANMARPPEGGDTDQLKAVAAGVGDIAISNSYYLARLAASDKPVDKEVAEKLAVFFPNQKDRGTHVNVSGAAVLKTAPHKDNAVKLLEYLASPEAQRYFADVSLEYPANPAVEPHPVLQAWGPFKQDPLNPTLYAKNAAEAAMITDRCGWR